MTCHICNADEYTDSLCFFCWAHVTLMGWSEQECRELETAIQEVDADTWHDRHSAQER
jgi:hypothetical protein